jgi:hypothetical protein
LDDNALTQQYDSIVFQAWAVPTQGLHWFWKPAGEKVPVDEKGAIC